MTAPGNRRDAYGAFSFKIELDGITEGFFRSCSGLKHEYEVTSLPEGGKNDYEHKLIGQGKYANITLKQGFATGDLLSAHMKHKRLEKVSIIMLGPGRKDAHTFRLRNAWISKWDGPELDASKNEIAVESIELVHEGFELQSSGGSGKK